ncbi:MAG: hypothetical protein C0P74_011435 [Gammaproteobacteria bacterium]
MRTYRFVSAGLLLVAVTLGGCQLAPTRIPEPPRQPEVLSSEPLRIERGCEVDGAVLVEYTVLQDGRTGNIEVSSGPECAREALVAWIASHRYAPQPADTPMRFEWILVTARRGS